MIAETSTRLAVWAPGIDCYYADCMGIGSRTYPVDLDIGELADGHHLVVRNISVSGSLVVDWVLVPEPAEGAHLWPEIRYDADVSPSGWNQWRADFDQFERPVPKARKVWFDFFRPYYEWYAHLDDHGQPDDDYLRNRVARLNLQRYLPQRAYRSWRPPEAVQ